MKGLFLILFFILNIFTANAYPSVYQDGLTLYEKGKAFEGYTFFAPMGKYSALGGAGGAYLIDMDGFVVHTWSLNYSLGVDAFLLPNGHLLYAGLDEDGPEISNGRGGIIQELDWNSKVVWEYKNQYMHHDIEKMPNGNVLAIIWQQLPENFSKNIIGGFAARSFNNSMWGDGIIEINPKGQIVWEWKGIDHMRVEDFSLPPEIPRIEWTHANSVKYLPAGNPFNGKESILLSLRQTDNSIIIDKQTKEIVWIWGKNWTKHQHDTTLLENGNILVFNNGVMGLRDFGGAVPHSSIIEMNPHTEKIVWEYKGKGLFGWRFFSGVVGGAQRLPNGNTLITDGLEGRIFEVNKQNETVWEYINPYFTDEQNENALFKAYRYSPSEIDWPEKLIADPGEKKEGLNYSLLGWVVAFFLLIYSVFVKKAFRHVRS